MPEYTRKSTERDTEHFILWVMIKTANNTESNNMCKLHKRGDVILLCRLYKTTKQMFSAPLPPRSLSRKENTLFFSNQSSRFSGAEDCKKLVSYKCWKHSSVGSFQCELASVGNCQYWNVFNASSARIIDSRSIDSRSIDSRSRSRKTGIRRT